MSDEEGESAAVMHSLTLLNTEPVDDARRAFLRKVNQIVADMNGPDFYKPGETADEPLRGAKMMHIPWSVYKKVVTDKESEIGVSEALSPGELLEVAAMNYKQLTAINHPNALFVSWLRAHICSRKFKADDDDEFGENNTDGDEKKIYKVNAWETYHEEIVVGPGPSVVSANNNGSITQFDDSIKALVDFIDTPEYGNMAALTTLLPVMAAIEFQKTNHHYIDVKEYSDAYNRHFRSAQIPDLAKTFNKASIIYDAVHWLGPLNMVKWIDNNDKNKSLPRGLMLKCKPAPAGTAVVFTQLAVWEQIAVFPGTADIMKAYAPNLRKMNDLAELVSKDRLNFHVYATLFGKDGRLDSDDTKAGMAAAFALAAVAQAFIETVARDSALSQAKALVKRAEQNMALYRLAKEAFSGALVKVRRGARVSTVSETLVPSVRRAIEPAITAAQLPEMEEGV